MKDIIRVRGVTKDYDARTRALNGMDLVIKEGEWTAIMGPSGSGKTTLLNIMSCLDSPTGGEVEIDGTVVTGLSQKALTRFRCQNIGLIFQQYHLVPYLSALENVMAAQYFSGTVDEEEAKRALEDVGLLRRMDHLPAHLSGGEQQRVCIARALVNAPRLIMADEPTGNLDGKNGRKVLELIRKLRDEGHTVVMVTHSHNVAALADRTVEMVDGHVVSDTAHRDPAGIRPREKAVVWVQKRRPGICRTERKGCGTERKGCRTGRKGWPGKGWNGSAAAPGWRGHSRRRR